MVAPVISGDGISFLGADNVDRSFAF